MRLKKGFTLAEILIVLMVIGVIATLTIPSMMKGVTEAQLKAGYKKAYNTISNFAAMEKVAGTLPARANDYNINALYTALNTSLSVKGFASTGIDTGSTLTGGDAAFVTCLNLSSPAEAPDGYEPGSLGTCQAGGDNAPEIESANVAFLTDEGGSNGLTKKTAAWIITDDNIAYAVVKGGASNQNAATKQQLAAMQNDEAAADSSSAVIIVDVNGLTKGPNTFEQQGVVDPLEPSSVMDTITGDQFKIYIGSDGASAGPQATTVTGRLASDLK